MELKKTVILNQISKYRTFDILGPFEKRITAIAWHPVYSQFAVSGSNRGELSLYNINRSTSEISPSINIKGSVLGLKFSSNDPSVVFVASFSGGLRQQDFSGQTTTIFTKVKWGWFNSLDVSYRKTLILAGDSSGRGHLLTTQGFKIWRSKDYMHHGSITHVEFNTRDENVFATASDDKFVKLWDMRMVANIGTKLKPVHVFPHLEPVNSACFSPSNGLSLLTTDQHSQLHIYSGPCWQEHLIIQHPHRQYEHLTPVKAAWHPIEDIIIVGRYPDENFLSADRRTIDFYDGNSGELLYRKNSPTENIISLNAFNITGECLALGSSCNVVFMKDENTIKGSSAVHKQDSQLLATK
ncbi:DNA damage-binding protein 2-like [Stegodyphus dumicola]|uniref:DNA damage-binding protein 2-like n=1 Tax=Stegodyphus dumicola TaxID=202533 RepID=UPI0015A77A52|nr:DNA damage-binding protein 2-like [Stegodyphus dumicola]